MIFWNRLSISFLVVFYAVENYDQCAKMAIKNVSIVHILKLAAQIKFEYSNLLHAHQLLQTLLSIVI